MINIDNRLLEKLNGIELSVFIHILKRINKTNESFPSRLLLQKETEFGRKLIAKAIKGLITKKILKTYQSKNEKGKFSKTIYIVNTDLASIYIPVKEEKLELETKKPLNRDTQKCNRDTQNRSTLKPFAGKVHLSINHYISINHYKGDPSNFYEKELVENEKRPEINNYNKFVSILYGDNVDEEILKGLLSIKKQVSYKQFENLILKSRAKNKKISGVLLKMNNDPKYYKKKKILSRVIHTWLDNDYK